MCKAWWDKDDPKYCMPVAGDYARHQEALRNYLWFRASNCGNFWTEQECLRIFGNQAVLTHECKFRVHLSTPSTTLLGIRA
ncbi:unnamed protein product [Symbiodinium pilosum]|uniref:Uncharacterized protein n=1 Tax=Symbiodinium pilosum TaxID=2952 RepID=A0A812ING5_SYMPI|nr:unnamed protein product [Symbiodinium pilosum]